jgi:hypothetical protein
MARLRIVAGDRVRRRGFEAVLEKYKLPSNHSSD